MLRHAVGHRRIIPAYAGSTCCSLEAASTAWDHPRIRGEHSGVGVPARGPIGSSPHTRGARGMVSSRGWGRRIIPAYAGSTPASPRGSGTNPDHPRIRGEHLPPLPRKRALNGSSPHTRGAPASFVSSSGNFQDHPRIRGEHRCLFHRRDGPVGSSPHTRGALPEPLYNGFAHGIIPAYAGSTRQTPRPGSGVRDHPRIRGEHPTRSPPDDTSQGSSPHTRGAHLAVGVQGVGDRIIPAYAGSTKSPCRRSSNAPDHPRIRGEHEKWGRARRPGLGSSPHTRGAPRGPLERGVSHRIIPAYAGSTSGVSFLSCSDGDHPRIRGEHFRSSLTGSAGSGSSPHTRGALVPRHRRKRGCGIIPAYAGSTAAGTARA